MSSRFSESDMSPAALDECSKDDHGKTVNDVLEHCQDPAACDARSKYGKEKTVNDVLDHCQEDPAASDAPSKDGKEKTVNDVLNHCQVIYGAIQDLDKKFDVIHGKVSKIHRLRVKSMWSNRATGYARRYYNHLHAKRLKNRKMEQKVYPANLNHPESYSPTVPVQEMCADLNHPESYSPTVPGQAIYADDLNRPESCSSPVPQQQTYSEDLSYPESYSPTVPVRRQYDDDDFQPNYEVGSSHSDTPSETEGPVYDDQDTEFNQSLLPDSPRYAYSRQSDNTSYDKSSVPDVSSNCSLHSRSQPAANVSPSGSAQGEASSPVMVHDPDAAEERDVDQCRLCLSSGVVTNFSPGREDYFKDPATWSVDEVIQFIGKADPQASSQLGNIFRKHDIDGKALLLLRSDIMMTYMGLKLGTAVKLCHYIERLKQKTGLHY